MTAGEIGSYFPVSRATISHHLAVLKEAELASDRKEGKNIYYELNLSVVEELMEWVFALMGGTADERKGLGSGDSEHIAASDGTLNYRSWSPCIGKFMEFLQNTEENGCFCPLGV